MIWREKRFLLLILGILLAANTIFFFTYRVQYQNRLDALEADLKEAESELTNARATRVRAQRQVAAYRQVEKDVNRIYEEQWATQGERLTAMIAEVKRLAIASDLHPRSYAFERADAKAPARVAGADGTTAAQSLRRTKAVGAVEVGVAFGVDGTYQQARRLINLLELSPQFVIIDGVDLSSRDGNLLSLNLHLKTLFKDTAPDLPAGRQS